MTDEWSGAVRWRTGSVAFAITRSAELKAIHSATTPAFPFSYVVSSRCLRELARGVSVSYAEGELRLGALVWRAEPVRRRSDPRAAPPRSQDLASWLGPAEPPAALPEGLLVDFAEALVEPGRFDPARRLLGLGPGLTPAGDDVLLGAWAVAKRWGAVRGRPGLDGAFRALLPQAPRRTTRLSAALLAAAAEGGFAPALAGFAEESGAGRWRSRAAARRLNAIGSSSGAATLWGARAAVAALEAG